METTKTGFIYKLTSPSGKSYIGQTTNIENRLSSYEKLKCKGQKKIYNAILKYTFENFTKEIILEIKDYNNLNELKSILDEREIYYINLYDSFNNGYNSTLGGGGALGTKHTNEAKRKISLANTGEKHPMFGKKQSHEQILHRIILCTGKKRSTDVKDAMSLCKRGEKNPMYGKVGEQTGMYGKIPYNKGKIGVSDETKMKMSKARIGKTQSTESIEKGKLTRAKNKAAKLEAKAALLENNQKLF